MEKEAETQQYTRDEKNQPEEKLEENKDPHAQHLITDNNAVNQSTNSVDELAAAESDDQGGGQSYSSWLWSWRQRQVLTTDWLDHHEEKSSRIKQLIYSSGSTAATYTSASTFILFLLFISIAAFVFSRGFDSTRSPFRSISFHTQFQPITTHLPDYPHIPPHLLNCTNPPQLTFTCPSNYPQQQQQQPPQSLTPTQTCPSYFRWIHTDLHPWKTNGIGITPAMLDSIEANPKFRHFRLTIVNGTAYVKQYDKAFQTRDVFTLWGVLQLLKMYPGRIPDLDLMFQCHDQPSIKKKVYRKAGEAPPLFHYCGSDETYDIVFPDWSFWGWPEINIKPWVPLKKDLSDGNKLTNWTDRKPYAYWKGNLYTGPRRKLGPCNSTHKWNAQIYNQDWGKEIRDGFKNSDMSKQCKHKYKLYMEGNAWSVSEKYILACDSMSLLVNPVFYDFFTRSLVPLKHYWPINAKDLCRSIKFAVDWGNSHPQQAQEIGREGSRFVQEEITMKNVYDYMFHLLSEYGKLMAYKPTVPPGAVELCSEKWVCASTDLEKIYKLHTMAKPSDQTEPPCVLPPPFKLEEVAEFVKEKGRRVRRVEDWKDGNS